MPALARLGFLLVVSVVVADPLDASSQSADGARAFETECARCHTPEEIRQATGGLRRLYWSDDRLTAWLQRHHAHDEEQARLIVRFLRATP